jgi:CBS domain containing-hemolysin-like protein
MGPLLVVTRFLTRLVSREASHAISRSEIAALVTAARSQGGLRDHESRVLGNALRLDALKVADVMTPRIVAVMAPAATTVREFLADARAAPYSRLPIFDRSEDDADHYVLQREVLRHAVEGDLERPLADFARPLLLLQEAESLGGALRKLIDQHEHLAVVGDEFGAVAGILTMEDVIETLLGVEIVDESDRFVDLRERAVRLRDERLERRRGAAEGGPRAGSTAPADRRPTDQ